MDKLDVIHTDQRTTPHNAPDRSGGAGGWMLALCEGASPAERRAWRQLRDNVYASETEARAAIAHLRGKESR